MRARAHGLIERLCTWRRVACLCQQQAKVICRYTHWESGRDFRCGLVIASLPRSSSNRPSILCSVIIVGHDYCLCSLRLEWGTCCVLTGSARRELGEQFEVVARYKARADRLNELKSSARLRCVVDVPRCAGLRKMDRRTLEWVLLTAIR